MASRANQEALQPRKISRLKELGIYLGLPFAESNPRKLVKRAQDNLGNLPLEILTYMSAYLEDVFENETLTVGGTQSQCLAMVASLGEVLAGVERVVNTPLPIAYTISIAQITWAYVLALPFQLVSALDWVAIPATVIAGYIILGLAAIGRELEDPFGNDVNDLPLDAYCHELASDLETLTSQPAPMNLGEWMAGARVLWPMSSMAYKGWEGRSTEEIRDVLKARGATLESKMERVLTMRESEGLTSGV